MPYNEMQYKAMQRNATQRNATQRNAMQCMGKDNHGDHSLYMKKNGSLPILRLYAGFMWKNCEKQYQQELWITIPTRIVKSKTNGIVKSVGSNKNCEK